MDETHHAPDPDLVYGLYTGGFRPQVVRLALRLDLFTPLAAGPLDAKAVARACDCDAAGAEALLDYLCALHLVERQAGAYRLTPTAAAFLVRRAPSYAGDWVLAQTDPALWAGVEGTLRGQRGDRPSFPWAQDAWLESLRPRRPAASRALWRAAGIEPGQHPGLRVLDLGCGCAIKSLVLAEDDPTVRVTCVDREEVLAVARQLANRMGVLSQATFVPGDLRTLDLGGAQYDAVLLGFVTDYLTPEENMALFRRVHGALAPGGRLVIDVHLATGKGHEFEAMSALLAWTFAGCRAYTFDDYRRWLVEAGFASPRRLGEHLLSAAK